MLNACVSVEYFAVCAIERGNFGVFFVQHICTSTPALASDLLRFVEADSHLTRDAWSAVYPVASHVDVVTGTATLATTDAPWHGAGNDIGLGPDSVNGAQKRAVVSDRISFDAVQSISRPRSPRFKCRIIEFLMDVLMQPTQSPPPVPYTWGGKLKSSINGSSRPLFTQTCLIHTL